jgi:hypothetical protein
MENLAGMIVMPDGQGAVLEVAEGGLAELAQQHEAAGPLKKTNPPA